MSDLQRRAVPAKCVPTTGSGRVGPRPFAEIRYIGAMLALVAAGALLVGPPALPEEPSPPPAIEGPVEGPVEPAAEPTAPVEAAAPVEPAPIEEEPAIVVAPAPVEPEPTLPTVTVVPEPDVMVLVPPTIEAPPPAAPPPWTVPSRKPPWSGSGRFVGGAFMLVIGTGMLVAATIEYADGRDGTQPMFSNIPGGIGSLVAGGFMIGTAVRDQHRLSDWEAATGRIAPPSGNGLIVAGVGTMALGGMAAIATSIAADMDLDAPRSIPAGWATAAVGLGGGVAMLIAGSVRRSKYERAFAMPTVAPTRAGASIGLTGRF
jgi:hypothetical protein